MYLDDREFSNNAIHFTSTELERYKKLESIALSCSLIVNNLIVQTAQEVLLLSGTNESLIAKLGEEEKEIVLPFRSRYEKPLKLEDMIEADYGNVEEEIELEGSILSALNDTKRLYFDVMLSEGISETKDFVTEIYELGFKYLEGLINLVEKGYSIRIFDCEGKLTNRGLKLDPLLMKVKTDADNVKRAQAELNSYIESMKEMLNKGLDKLPVMSKKISYEENYIKKTRKK